jgi:hypothetical protein
LKGLFCKKSVVQEKSADFEQDIIHDAKHHEPERNWQHRLVLKHPANSGTIHQ